MSIGLYDVMMREIAHQSHVPLEEVRQSFNTALHELDAEARVKDFLPLLAMKHVRRDYLYKRQHPQPALKVAGAATPSFKPGLPARLLPVLTH